MWLKELCKNYQPSVLFVTLDIDEALLLADSIYVFSPRPAQISLHIKGPTSGSKRKEAKREILSILKADEERAANSCAHLSNLPYLFGDK